MKTEYWEVDKLVFSGWVHDTDEYPRFTSFPAALAWADKLATIHQDVRIRHIVTETIRVTGMPEDVRP